MIMNRFALAFIALVALCASAVAQVVTVKQFPEGPVTNNLTASATGTTGAIAATLTGATGKYTYLCGFTVTSAGTTAAASGTITVTGTIGGTMSFIYVFVSSGQGVFGIAFPGCITSSAANTSIVVNVPAGGAGTTVAATAWGYTN